MVNRRRINRLRDDDDADDNRQSRRDQNRDARARADDPIYALPINEFRARQNLDVFEFRGDFTFEFVQIFSLNGFNNDVAPIAFKVPYSRIWSTVAE